MTWWTDPAVLDWVKAASPLIAAVVVYRGVKLTGKITSRLAKKRLRHDRRQAALDRSYADRAKAFLDAQKMLREISDVTSYPYTMLPEDWKTRFNWVDADAMVDRLTVYGPPESASLFREAWTQNYEALCCFSVVSTWYEAANARGLSPWSQSYEGRQGKKAEYDGADHHYCATQVGAYFTALCQANLNDEDYEVPTDRRDTSSEHWRTMIATHKPLAEIEAEQPVDRDTGR